MPGSIPREKRSGSSAGVVGALPGRSLGRPAPRGRGLGPQSRAHRLYFQGPVFSPSPDLRREGIVFLRRDHDPETSDSRTSCSSSSSSSAQSNQLSTTLQRYRAQQQQATPCACDTSARYCVELLWKAPEIRHSYLLVLVPNISRLLVAVLCGSRGQPREVSSTYAYHTCLLLLSSSI